MLRAAIRDGAHEDAPITLTCVVRATFTFVLDQASEPDATHLSR